jgi:hypothetical protein
MCDPGDELPNSGGVFISHDAGGSWEPIWGPDRHVYGIQVDPYNPNNLFAVTFEGQMMVLQYEGPSESLSGGEGYDAGFWNIHQEYGFNFRQASSPFIDVNHPDFVFVSTFGGNIWRGPSNVTPRLAGIAANGDAVEGFDPNVLSYVVEVAASVDAVDLSALGVYGTAVIGGTAVGAGLDYGDNVFEISVSNEIGTLATYYTVNVYRAAADGTRVSAVVRKLGGNMNEVTITVIDAYYGEIAATYGIANNGSGTFRVGPYLVFVSTSGNTSVTECRIAEAGNIKIDVSAKVLKGQGNTNSLTINVVESYYDGSVRAAYGDTIAIINNAAGIYAVGPYLVYVATAGNDKVTSCHIVE